MEFHDPHDKDSSFFHQSLEWNEDSNEDLAGTDSSPNIVGDGSEHTPEIKEDNVASVTEENEWDRLLRVR